MPRPRKGNELRVRVDLSIDPEVKRDGIKLAKAQGESLSELVERLLIDEMDSEKETISLLRAEESRRKRTNRRANSA